MKMQIGKSDVKAYFLVLDENGMPIIDDIKSLPNNVWEQLTPEQKQHLKNVHNLD